MFDMFTPDYNLKMPNNSGVCTCASLEQLGNNYHKFLDFLFEKKPKIIINMEPIIEFYDDTNLLDYLAIKYHNKIKYLNG